MSNKFFVYAGLLSGALFGAPGDGHSQTVALQKAAYSGTAQTAPALPASDVVKTRVTFPAPKTDHMIHVERRDAPAGYINTRPYALAAADAPQPTPDQIATDWRIVTGARVNLRAQPGTGAAVLGSLTRGTRAVVISQLDNGWVQLEVPDQGLAGFMSGKFLSAQN